MDADGWAALVLEDLAWLYLRAPALRTLRDIDGHLRGAAVRDLPARVDGVFGQLAQGLEELGALAVEANQFRIGLQERDVHERCA